jgi:hypothetical protein
MGMAPDMGGESGPGSYNWQKGRIAQLEAENAALKAENAALHKCVQAAEPLVEAAMVTMNNILKSEFANYDAARKELP